MNCNIFNTCKCSYVAQMKNVLSQLIELYLDDNVIIAMESGNNASGRLGSLVHDTNSGILELVNFVGVVLEVISLFNV